MGTSAQARGQRRNNEVRSQVVVRGSAVGWNAGGTNSGEAHNGAQGLFLVPRERDVLSNRKNV